MKPQAVEPRLPKLIIIAGADTHHGGGPSHNLHDEHREYGHLIDSHVVPAPVSTAVPPGGLLQDIARDIGIPPSFNTENAKQAVADLFSQTKGKHTYTGPSRELDKDEARGVWVLLGLLAGSWIAAGIIDRASASEGKESH